jgi:hypothetical protein
MAINVTLGNFSTLQNASIIATLNANNTLIETGFADCLSRAGTSPNAMASNLDVNSFQIINLPAPATLNSPVRLIDLVSAAVGLPSTAFGLLAGNNTWTGLNIFTKNVEIGANVAADSLLTVNNNTVVTPGSLPSGMIVHVVGQAATNARVLIDGFTGTPNFTGRAALGTTASPSALTINSAMLSVTAMGYGATGYSSTSRAAIAINAAENWSDSAQGTYMPFSTTATGSTTQAERMRIFASGGVSIGNTTDPGATNLSVTGTITSAVQYFGINPFSTYTLLQTAGGDGWRWALTNDTTLSLQHTTNGFSSATFAIKMLSTGAMGLAGVTPLSTLDVFGGVAIGTYAGLNAAPSNGMIVSGNVGFGTNNPSQPVHLSLNQNGSTWLEISNTNAGASSGVGLLLVNDGASFANIQLLSSGTVVANGLFIRNVYNAPIVFQTNNAEAMRLTGAGGLNIGTSGTDAGAKNLRVEGSISTLGNLSVTGGTSNLTMSGNTITGGNAANSQLYLTSTSSGSPSGDLTAVRGTQLFFQNPSGGTTYADYSSTTANVWTFSAAVTTTGKITVPGLTNPLLSTSSAITTGAGASAGTLTNAPAVGNPTKWFPISDNGTTRYVPAW